MVIGGRLPTCLIKGVGPGELFGSRCYSSIDRVHFDVAGNSLKLRFAANKPIVALILPERLSGEAEDAIAFSSSEAFERLHDLRDLDQRRYQEMNMVRHYDVGVKPVLLQVAVVNSIDDHTGNIRFAKRQRAGIRLIEQTVQGEEGFSGCGRCGKFPIRWKTALKTPAKKNGLSAGTIVGQPAAMEDRHEVKVNLSRKSSRELYWADRQSAPHGSRQGLR